MKEQEAIVTLKNQKRIILVNKKNNKLIIIGGIIGLIIGIISSLGLRNDNFIYIYAAPYYLYRHIFHGLGHEGVVIISYFCLLGVLNGYFYSDSNFQKKRIRVVLLIVILHVFLTIIGLKAISEDIRSFLTNMPTKIIADAISGSVN